MTNLAKLRLLSLQVLNTLILQQLYLILILGDSSDTEEPIEVDYSAFVAQLNASAENPLTSNLAIL